MKGRSIHDLLRDYEDALKGKLPRELAARLEDYERFVRARSHILGRDPAQVFAQGAAQARDSAVGEDFRRLAEEGHGPERPWFRLRNPETETQRDLRLRIEAGTAVYAVAWLMIEGRSHTLVGGLDGCLRLYDLTTGRLVEPILRGHTREVSAVALSGDGRHALSGSSDHTLRWWDLEAGRCLAVFTCDYPVTAVALCAQPPHVAVVGDHRGRVYFFDILEPGPD